MAASGQRDPDLSVVRVGADRGEVELQLGKPIEHEDYMSGVLATYAYETGDKGSAGRAAFYAIMDVLTLFIWELFFTPVEVIQGDAHTVLIAYNSKGKISSIQYQ